MAPAAAWAAMTELYASYTVQPKDTLQGVSRSLLKDPTKWAEVAKLNGMKNPHLIFPGQTINVPRSLLNMASQPLLALPGKVLSVQGDVKMGGQSVQVGASVPEGARLETGANSSVLVQLGDGSKLQMMPKTLSEVTSQHGYALRDPASSASTTWFSGAIRLVSGVLETLANKQASRLTPLTVTTPTSVIGVRGTEYRVSYENPVTRITLTEVLEGAVQVDNTARQVSTQLKAGFGVVVDPNTGENKMVALLPALAASQLPTEVLRTGAHSTTGSASATRAEWTVGSLAGATSYRAQFATDAKFALIQSDFQSNTPTLDINELPDGSYYARVRGVDTHGLNGRNAVQLVQVKTAPAPVPVIKSLVWPLELSIGATADYMNDGVLLKVYSKSADLPQQLSVQAARDAAFTQDAQTATIAADGTLLLRNLKAGERSYVRFSSTATATQPAAHAVFTLDVPANWGTTVMGMTQALQPVR